MTTPTADELNALAARIDAIAREAGNGIADRVIADLHSQGIFDVIAEEDFRRMAIVQARQTILSELTGAGTP